VDRELERFKIAQKDFGWRNAGPWKGGRRPIGSQLGKGPIESGIISDGSNTISGPCTSARDSTENLEEIGSAE